MKPKILFHSFKPLFLFAVGSATALSGCLTTMPTGMPSMMPGEMLNAMGGASTAGMPYGGAIQSSGGANWAGRNMLGSGGIMGVNAESFASNVHNLEIGNSTKEDALAALGAPMGKSAQGLIETWVYSLMNQGANEGFAQVYFKNNKIQYISVMKSGFSGGSMSSEVIYTKGVKPSLQDML